MEGSDDSLLNLFGGYPFDESGNSIGCLHKFFKRSRKASPNVVFSMRSEGRAWDYRHLLFTKKTVTKLNFIHAEFSNLRKDIKRASRQMTFQTDFITPTHDEISAFSILLTHF